MFLNPMVASGNYVGRLPDYFALFMKIRFQCSDIPVEIQDIKKPPQIIYFLEGNKIGNLRDLKFLEFNYVNQHDMQISGPME